MKQTEPTIFIDTREKKPLAFNHLPTETAKLDTGDYAVKGLDSFVVERKSVADYATCCKRDHARFIRQCERLSEFKNRHLVIVGTDKELALLIRRHRIDLRQAEHTLLSLAERYGITVHRVATPAAAALRIETLAFTAWRNSRRAEGDHITFPEWVECGILPRFSEAKTAAQVLDKMLEWKMLPYSFFNEN